MLEGPGKSLNFSKIKDQKKFGNFNEIDKKLAILDARDEAQLLEQWMILDHIKPNSEQAAFYIKKLEKLRKLYRHNSTTQISERLNISKIEDRGKYIKHTEAMMKRDNILDVIQSIKTDNPGINKKQIVEIVKNIIAAGLAEGDYYTSSRLADEYLEDEELTAVINKIQDREEGRAEALNSASDEGNRQIQERLEPALISEVSLILDLKNLIEANPEISRDELQERLLSGLKEWKDKPFIYQELEIEFTDHLDRYLLRKRDIDQFKTDYEKDPENTILKILGFKPKKSVEIIYSPWAVSICLDEQDFTDMKKSRNLGGGVRGWHWAQTAFNVLSKKPESYVLHHENLHAFEDLIRRVSMQGEVRTARLIDLINLNAPTSIIENELKMVLKSLLVRIKEEILNGFHEGDSMPAEEKLLREIFDKQIDKTKKITIRIAANYIGEYEDLYDKIREAAEKNGTPKVKNLSEHYRKIFFNTLAKGLRSYGKGTKLVRNSARLNDDQDFLYILGNLLPFHQYYRIPGIIKRMESVD